MDKDKKTGGLPLAATEADAKQRDGKFLVMGSRRDGGQLAPIHFYPDEAQATTAAEILTTTGFAAVEIYTRVGTFTRG